MRFLHRSRSALVKCPSTTLRSAQDEKYELLKETTWLVKLNLEIE